MQLDFFQENNYESQKAIYDDILEPELGSWYQYLNFVDKKNLFETLERVKLDRADSNVYPQSDQVLRIFRKLDLGEIKVVILGQDPYHTPGLANGYAFGCSYGLSPSLEQIVKAMKKDLNKDKLEYGNPSLNHLVEQGVFLFNTILTVKEGKALSHKDIGWLQFTRRIISIIDSLGDAVFLLWGGKAREFVPLIKNSQIAYSSHPASAKHTGKQWKCNHFSIVNTILEEKGKTKIKWI